MIFSSQCVFKSFLFSAMLSNLLFNFAMDFGDRNLKNIGHKTKVVEMAKGWLSD
jgi:hypothetical protein